MGKSTAVQTLGLELVFPAPSTATYTYNPSTGVCGELRVSHICLPVSLTKIVALGSVRDTDSREFSRKQKATLLWPLVGACTCT